MKQSCGTCRFWEREQVTGKCRMLPQAVLPMTVYQQWNDTVCPKTKEIKCSGSGEDCETN